MHQQGINYDKWNKMELLELWQGIHLLLNKEPNWTELKRKRASYGDYGNTHFWNKFEEILEIAKASILCDALKPEIFHPDIIYCKFSPIVFFQWVQKKGFSLSEQLLELISIKIEGKDSNKDIAISVVQNELDYKEKELSSKNTSNVRGTNHQKKKGLNIAICNYRLVVKFSPYEWKKYCTCNTTSREKNKRLKFIR